MSRRNRYIRAAHARYGVTFAELGALFGISHQRAHQIYLKEQKRTSKPPVYRQGDPFLDFKYHYEEVMNGPQH